MQESAAEGHDLYGYTTLPTFFLKGGNEEAPNSEEEERKRWALQIRRFR